MHVSAAAGGSNTALLGYYTASLFHSLGFRGRDMQHDVFVGLNPSHGKYTQFELPGKFMKVNYNDSLSDKSM